MMIPIIMYLLLSRVLNYIPIDHKLLITDIYVYKALSLSYVCITLPVKKEDLTDDMGGKGAKSLLDVGEEDTKNCEEFSLGMLLLACGSCPCLGEVENVACFS